VPSNEIPTHNSTNTLNPRTPSQSPHQPRNLANRIPHHLHLAGHCRVTDGRHRSSCHQTRFPIGSLIISTLASLSFARPPRKLRKFPHHAPVHRLERPQLPRELIPESRFDHGRSHPSAFSLAEGVWTDLEAGGDDGDAVLTAASFCVPVGPGSSGQHAPR